MIWLSKEPVDYAEQSKNIIVHFSPKREAVLLEILDASAFLKQAATHLPKKIIKSIFTPTSSPSIAYKNK